MKSTSLRITKGEIVETVTMTELCRHCGVSADWVMDLVDQGIIDTLDGEPRHWRFHSSSLNRVAKAFSLRRDIGVNLSGIALVLDLLEERDRLLASLAQFQATMDADELDD